MNLQTGALIALLASMAGLSAAAEETVIYSFAGGSDGASPRAPLLRDAFGNLYGAAAAGGGACDCGTIFRLTPSGKKVTLYVFTGGNDGASPNGGLVMDADGNLYGTANRGGESGLFGTVFKLARFSASSRGSLTVLHSFMGGSDGTFPEYGLTMGDDGYLYGTTSTGGPFGGGTAFTISPTDKYKLLHGFGTSADGVLPQALLGVGNTFYGVAKAGGANNTGTVFRMKANGDVKALYTFEPPGGSDGFEPQGSLLRDANGVLYGTTQYGGSENEGGTVFSLAPDGSETVLHIFMGDTNDGSEPIGGLVSDGQGNLFGVTIYGGPGTDCFGNGCGTVFKLAPNGTTTILHAFSGGADGSNPDGTLIGDGAGGFYGATAEGGAHDLGAIFTVTK